MITEEILHIAMEQSAEDINCKTEDFLKNQNVIVPFRFGKKSTKISERANYSEFCFLWK